MGAQGRITQIEAAGIAARARRDATQARREAADAEENRLVAAVLAEAVGEDEMNSLTHLTKVRRSWVSLTDRVYVRANGVRAELRTHSLAPSYPRVVPTPISEKTNEFAPSRELSDRVLALQDERRSISELDEKIRARVVGLIASCRTVKRLAEAWPEGEAYWRPVYEAWRGGRNLPAVDVRGLNKLLGLPREGGEVPPAAPTSEGVH